MKTGYEQTTVAEIRDTLRTKWAGYVDEAFIDGNTKTVLVRKLIELEARGEDAVAEETICNVTEDTFKEAVLEEPEQTPITDVPPTVPPFGSTAWTEWVKRQFEDDELEEGNPTCDGCRRLVEKLIGPILSTRIEASEAPADRNRGVATVVVEVVVEPNKEYHPLCGQTVVVSDIANCGKYNTPEPFHLHQSATAATRAEGRALRKILRLKRMVVAEEIGEGDIDYDDTWNPSKPITDEQINMIDILCERQDISPLKFINCGERQYKAVQNVTFDTAQKMIQHLNKIQQGRKPKPNGVEGYQPDWRK